MRVIGIMGPEGAGKSTVAKHLVATFGVERMRFAGPLKQVLKDILLRRGINDELVERMIEGDLKNVNTPYLEGKSPRHAMITIGTDWGRECIGWDFWVHCLEDEIQMLAKTHPDMVLVIDDVRFENEANMVRRLGGEIWRVTGRTSGKRPPLWKVALSVLTFGAYNPVHISERGWRKITPNIDIDNSYDEEVLTFQVNSAFNGPLKELLNETG